MISVAFKSRSCNKLNQYLIRCDAISEPVEQASTMIIFKSLVPVANMSDVPVKQIFTNGHYIYIRPKFEFLANFKWFSCHPLNSQTLIQTKKKNGTTMIKIFDNAQWQNILPIFCWVDATSTICLDDAKRNEQIFYLMFEWRLIYSMSFWFAHFKWSALLTLEAKGSTFLGEKTNSDRMLTLKNFGLMQNDSSQSTQWILTLFKSRWYRTKIQCTKS